MENERKFWAFLIVLVGISAFLAGAYWNTVRTNTILVESLETKMGLLQDENAFLLERDLQILEEFDDLRNVLKDLEGWMEESQEEQDVEFEGYPERFDRLNDRLSSIWPQIYDMKDDIRKLKRLYCGCECVDFDDEYGGPGYYGGPWCDWCECYCSNCSCPYCGP